jgi:uncharacterized protein
MKYLVLLALLAVVYAFVRGQRAPSVKQASRRAAAPQNMVACAHCGLHVPQGEALSKDGRSYCCAAHRDLGGPPP